ncbi:MAG: hypothetical protein RIE53_08550 [Rhodothermales bacterium]
MKATPLLLLLFMLAACSSETIDNTGLTDPDPDPDPEPVQVSYAQDIQPLFNASCGGVGCHIGQATNGVSLGSHEQVTTSVGFQYGTPVVIPGDAAGSPIIDKISVNPRFGSRMPLGRAPLEAADINRVRVWIEHGAPNN